MPGLQHRLRAAHGHDRKTGNRHLLLIPTEKQSDRAYRGRTPRRTGHQSLPRTQKIRLSNTREPIILPGSFPEKSQLLIVGAAHITDRSRSPGKTCMILKPSLSTQGVFLLKKTQFPDPPQQLFVDWPAEVLPKIQPRSIQLCSTADP